MDKKWLWLLLFLLFAGFGAYKWFYGASAPDSTQGTGDPSEEVAQDPDLPVMGSGKNQVAPPPVPGARREQGGFEARPPVVDHIEPPGFEPRMQNENQFAPPSANSPPPTQPMPGDPPASAFSPVPPSNFENPGFVTPPSPPPQMDNEAVPFDDDPPPPPSQGQFEEVIPQDGGGGGTGDMPEDFSPPIED